MAKPKAHLGFVHGFLMMMAALIRSAGRSLRMALFVVLIGLNIAIPFAMTVSESAFSLVAGAAGMLWDGVDILTRERRKTAKLSDDLTTARSYQALSEKQIIRQHADIEAQNTKLTQMEIEARARAKRVRELTAQVDGLKLHPSQTKVTLRGKAMSSDDAVQLTLQRVDERFVRSLSKEIASLGAEAIPYVGIAVMIALLTDDIKQSCDSVQDIQALADALSGTSEVMQAGVCNLSDKIPTVETVWNNMLAAPVALYDGAKEALPEFYWEAGWDDLSGKVAGGLTLLSQALGLE